ncbi:MAG: DUF1573 domain-containing protein [Firmicutes bacterium]|nr:DUF1573 domain-containing protein [Bacillota bacterium]
MGRGLGMAMVAVVCVAGSSAEPARKVDPARISIAPKGRVKLTESLAPREKRDLPYTFTNTSASPISLRVLDLSPGVTVSGPALERPLKAGESVALTMHVDADGWVGWQRRNVKLITDDPKQGQYFLPVEMTIRPDLTVENPRLNFGVVRSYEHPQIAFRFTRETGDPTVIQLTSPLPDHLESSIEHKGNQTMLVLSLRPEKLAPGTRLGLETLQLTTNAPLQPRFTLYAEWEVRRTVEANPPRLTFLRPKPERQVLTLKRPDGRAFALKDARIEGEGFTLLEVPKGAKSKHRLTILRTASSECHAMLHLHFVDDDEKLDVPVAYLPA